MMLLAIAWEVSSCSLRSPIVRQLRFQNGNNLIGVNPHVGRSGPVIYAADEVRLAIGGLDRLDDVGGVLRSWEARCSVR